MLKVCIEVAWRVEYDRALNALRACKESRDGEGVVACRKWIGRAGKDW